MSSKMFKSIKISKGLKIALLTILVAFSLVIMQQRIESKIFISKMEIRLSCEAGLLFYILKYGQHFPMKERVEQYTEIKKRCKLYTDLYEEIR